jgi:membrane-associated protease RseP (regulator of RpoE activity)
MSQNDDAGALATDGPPHQPTAPPRPAASGRRRTGALAQGALGEGPGAGGQRPAGERGSNLRLLALVGAVALLGWLAGRSLLVVIGALLVTIVLHELGHYLTARWSGMKVTEFFVGFGPRLWSFRRGETEYGLKALPFGAYVKIVGMHNYEEVEPADEARTYRQKSYPRRLAVAVAGSTMHFLIAVVLLFTLLVGFGTPGGGRLFRTVDPTGWTVAQVLTGSAAEAAGLRAGDRIVSVDGKPVVAWEDLGALVRPNPGREVTLTVERDGQQVSLPATLSSETQNGEVVGRLGVSPHLEYPPVERVTPLRALPDTARDFGDLVSGTVSGMGKVFSPSGLSSFARQVFNAREPAAEPSAQTGTTAPSNPDDGRLVSIVGATRLGARLLDDGVAEFLRFMAVLNVFIGLFNLVPLLPLDGGHVAIATYERIREIGRHGRRYFVDVTRLLPVTYAVVMALVLIGVSSIYLDVVKPISLP